MGDTSDIAFGNDPRQKLDLYNHDAAHPRPLVVNVHGGGWTGGDKRRNVEGVRNLCRMAGHAMAAVNYRLVDPAHPGRVTVIHQVADVRDAMRHLHENATSLGIRSDRTVLFGFSAGAMLGATALLMGWLPPTSIPAAFRPKAAMIVDGALFDIAATMAWPRLHPRQRANLEAIFGTDRDDWDALSPAILCARIPPDPSLSWTLISGGERQEISTVDFHNRLVKAGWKSSLFRTGLEHGQFLSGRFGFANPESEVSTRFRSVLASVS